MIKFLRSPAGTCVLACALALSLCSARVQAGRGDDFQQTEGRLDDLSLDVVAAPLPTERVGEPVQVFDALRADVQFLLLLALTIV